MSQSKDTPGEQTSASAGNTPRAVELKAWIAEIRTLEDKLIQLKHELIAQAARPSQDTDQKSEATFLLIRLAGRVFAAPLAYIDEVVQMVEVTPLPEKTANVLGLVDFHGELLAVIDLAQLVGMGESTVSADSVLVICSFERTRFGLMVNEATDVVTVKPEAVQVVDEVLPGVLKASGVVRIERQMAIILDIWSIALAAQLGISSKDARQSRSPELR